MDRDELVERMALAIAPYMGCEDCGTGPGECPCRDAARAALAVAEPAVREACAVVAQSSRCDDLCQGPDEIAAAIRAHSTEPETET